MRFGVQAVGHTNHTVGRIDDDPSPLEAAELTRVVREKPREAEILHLVKKISGAGPLPPQ
jgi:hypothetical protein